MPFQMDTGSAVSVINCKDYARICQLPLTSSDLKLKAYSGHAVEVKGKCNVAVTSDGSSGEVPLYIVTGDGPLLLCRSWIQKFRLLWGTILKSTDVVNKLSSQAAASTEQIERLVDEFKELFSDGLGLL